MPSRRYGILAVCLALLLAPLIATAGSSGRILVLSGDAWIERDGENLRVKRDALVREGDVIVTGPGAKAQWWLEDDSIYTLGSNSRLKVEEFKLYRGAEQQKSGLGRIALNLLKGGFRTITGFIGSRNRSAYSVRTPVATMGIRGTDYTSILLEPDEIKGLAPGLYVRVATGAVEISNPNGTLQVGAGEIGFVPVGGGAPRLVIDAPTILLAFFWEDEFQFGVDFFLELDVDIRIEPERPASPS